MRPKRLAENRCVCEGFRGVNGYLKLYSSYNDVFE